MRSDSCPVAEISLRVLLPESYVVQSVKMPVKC